MAEVQTYSNSGEMTQRFIEFVMMQSQHAALFLGQIPNPQTGESSVNLEAADMFIGQLEMIADKTRGNLNADESKILANAVTSLRMVFEEISHGEPVEPAAPEPVIESKPALSADVSYDSDNKKRFSKSYGA